MTPSPSIGLRVPGAGGTALAVDAYPAAEPGPVVVTRTPYGRGAHRAEGLAWAARGVAFVVQDVRGRYDSDGEWSLYRNERADGAALVDWVVERPWCDGRVVTSGGSYAGFTAWAAAVSRPDAVRAVLSTGPAMGLDRVKFDPSGILRLAEHATWWLTRAESRTTREGLVAAVAAADPDWLAHLPVVDLPSRMWARLDRWADVVRAGPDRAGPEAVTDAELAAFPGAAYHVGGWYDLLLPETLHHWRTVGAALTPRPPRALLVGPWDHGFGASPSARVGARDHGPGARVPLGPRQLDWLRTVLAGSVPAPEVPDRPGTAEPSLVEPSLAEVFVVGDGWRSGLDWPPRTSPWTLHATADGGLASAVPATAGEHAFRYDPQDPFPSTEPGADRAHLDHRDDIARWTGAPLVAPLTLAGTPEVHLVATSDAPATDWVVRLCERTADGRALPLAAGAVDTGRCPGPAHRVALTPLAVTLPAGSRVELEVTSSDFPLLARALNTGGDRCTTSEVAVAHQRVRSGRGRTRVVLQVVVA